MKTLTFQNVLKFVAFFVFIMAFRLCRHAAMGSAIRYIRFADKPDASLTRLSPKGGERVITPTAGKRGKAERSSVTTIKNFFFMSKLSFMVL